MTSRGARSSAELSRLPLPPAQLLDEAGINDDRDMFQEMRLVLRLHRVPGMDDVVPTCPQVFQMATSGGAATTGFADRIGVIRPALKTHRTLTSPRHRPTIGASPSMRGRPTRVSVAKGVAMAKKGNGIFLVFVPVHQQVEPEAVARPGGLREGRSIKAPTTVTLTPRHL